MEKKAACLLLIAMLMGFTGVFCRAKEPENVLEQIQKHENKIKNDLEELLNKKGLEYPAEEIYIRIFKYEEELEVWVWDKENIKFILLKTYKAYNLPYTDINVKKTSFLKILGKEEEVSMPRDEIGPKEKIGDSKVPEGFYRILYHNPWSSFYLSLAVGYPNPADAIRGFKNNIIGKTGKDAILKWWEENLEEVDSECINSAPSIWYDKNALPLGNQIFIHGSRVTIGCVPIGDEGIREVFVLTNPEYVGGTRADIFPCRFTEKNIEKLKEIGKLYPDLYEFWMNLKKGYEIFEEKRILPEIWVNPDTGFYEFQSNSERKLIKI